MTKTNIDLWNDVLATLPFSFRWWFRKEKKYLEANLFQNSKVLDVGCGNGRTIFNILDITDNTTGIDNDEKSVNEARKNFSTHPNIKIIKAEAEKLPFKDGQFDFAICTATFGNFGNQKEKVLREMKRVLNKNGKIIISVYSEKALGERLKAYKAAKIKVLENNNGNLLLEGNTISEQFSLDELLEIFRKVGLRVDDVKKLRIAYLCTLSIPHGNEASSCYN